MLRALHVNILVAFLSIGVFTSVGQSTENTLSTQCPVHLTLLSGEKKSFDLAEARTYRGFFGGREDITEELKLAANAQGIDAWRVAIYVRPTLEEAQAHLAITDNLHNMPVYIIAEDIDLDTLFAGKDLKTSKSQTVELFSNLLNRKDIKVYQPDPHFNHKDFHSSDKVNPPKELVLEAIKKAVGENFPSDKPLSDSQMRKALEFKYELYNQWAQEQGKLKKPLKPQTVIPLVEIPLDKFRDIVDPKKFYLNSNFRLANVYSDGRLGAPEIFAYAPGLSSPTIRGIMWRRKTQSASMRSDLLNLAYRGEERGYAFTVNGGPENITGVKGRSGADAIFELLSLQDRREIHTLTGQPGPKDPTANRFRPEKVEEEKRFWLNLLSQNKAFSVETWSPPHPITGERILLSAAVGENIGSMYYPDTVAYNTLFVQVVNLAVNPQRAKINLEEKLALLTPEEQKSFLERLHHYQQFVSDIISSAKEKNPKVEPKSLFMNVSDAIEIAKINMYMIGAICAKNNIPVYDLFSVTNFTESIGGMYVSRHQFERLAKILRNKEASAFNSPGFWHAADSIDWVPLEKRGLIPKGTKSR